MHKSIDYYHYLYTTWKVILKLVNLKLNAPIFDILFKIQLLLYGDDTVLLDDKQTNLQNASHCLANYCDDLKLDVNTEKTNIVFFSKRKSRNLYVFYFIG